MDEWTRVFSTLEQRDNGRTDSEGCYLALEVTRYRLLELQEDECHPER